jgi:hypothetical protein
MNLSVSNLRLWKFIAAGSALGLLSTAQAAEYQWDFSDNINSTFGNGTLEYADSSSQTLTTFGTTDGGSVPHIGGEAAAFMRVPAFTTLGEGYNATFHSTAPNGSGSYVNQYSIVLDVLSPASINWTPVFNADPANSSGNDADFYISDMGAIGIGALGYSADGLIAPNTWYRIGFTADFGAGTAAYYIDGNQVGLRTGGSLVDGRFSLYSNVDAGPDLRLFNEGDISGQYTHELLVNSFYFTDRTLSASEVAALGGPHALGVVVPEPCTWAFLGLGAMMLFITKAAGLKCKDAKE